MAIREIFFGMLLASEISAASAIAVPVSGRGQMRHGLETIFPFGGQHIGDRIAKREKAGLCGAAPSGNIYLYI